MYFRTWKWNVDLLIVSIELKVIYMKYVGSIISRYVILGIKHLPFVNFHLIIFFVASTLSSFFALLIFTWWSYTSQISSDLRPNYLGAVNNMLACLRVKNFAEKWILQNCNIPYALKHFIASWQGIWNIAGNKNDNSSSMKHN